jgi:membrane associated rhomboid family serine protease
MIFTDPFLHLSWSHIIGNSEVLVPVGFLAAYRSLVKFAWVSVAIIVVSGLFVWLVSPSGGVTVGASAVIAGWLGYVILRGWFDRCAIDLIAGVVCVFLFLPLVQLVPNGDATSWQGHLSGIIVGMACAYFLSDRSPVKVRKHIADVNKRAEGLHVQEKLTKIHDDYSKRSTS